MDNDEIMSKNIAAGLEWVSQNYDSLDEAGKAAFDKMTYGVYTLLVKYGLSKGVNIGTAIGGFVAAVVMSGAVSVATNIALDKWKSWRENRLNKTETTDSE